MIQGHHARSPSWVLLLCSSSCHVLVCFRLICHTVYYRGLICIHGLWGSTAEVPIILEEFALHGRYFNPSMGLDRGTQKNKQNEVEAEEARIYTCTNYDHSPQR